MNDFLFVLLSGLLFECALIAYASGEMRAFYVSAVIVSFLLYRCSLHKVVFPVIKTLLKPLAKFNRFLSKKLKKSKKSFKKVLHFGK